MTNWDQKREQINRLHRELQKKPDSEKILHWCTPAGILNAYREGDLSFADAVQELKRRGNKMGIIYTECNEPATTTERYIETKNVLRYVCDKHALSFNPVTEFVPLLVNREKVKQLVSEGMRIGRVPWCCDAYVERKAAIQLRGYGIIDQETMEETIARRERRDKANEDSTD